MSLAQQILHISDSVNIIDVARIYKIALDDENRTACFEGHDSDSSTLHFDEQTQIYQCTSPGCRLHGNVFDLVARQEGCCFEAAVKIVAQMGDLDFSAEGHGSELNQYTLVRNCLREAGRFYARNINLAMPYLDLRGISRATAEQYLVGRSGTKDELKQFLMTQRNFRETTIRDAGLLNQYGEDFFRDRVVIPNLIGGQIVSFYGRSLDDNDKVHHLRMGNDRFIIGEGPFNWDPRQYEIVMVEGIFDALSLIDKGFTNTIAMFGTQGFSTVAMSERLENSSVRRVFVCYDGDGPGQDAGVRDAHAIESMGIDSRIVLLDGIDPNEFMLGHHPSDFQQVLTSALTPIRYEIERVDDNWEPERKLEALKPVLMRCKTMAPLDRAVTVGRLCSKLNCGIRVVNQHIDALPDERVVEPVLIDCSEYTEIHPSLEFVNGKALMMIGQLELAEGNGKSKWVAYMVTSDREIFRLDHEALGERGYYTDCDIVSIRQRYSPDAVKDFVEGMRKGDLVAVFWKVHRLLRNFVDFEDEDTYFYLTAWIIGTYFFPIFHYYPYVHFTGTKNVGKTKTMLLMSGLCFNAILSTSATAASLFRAVDAWRSTVLMDETEFLNTKEFSEKRLILNGGFQKGSYVHRTEKEGDKRTPKQFHNYCPKAFSSIEGLDDTLASRTVQICMHRSYDNAIKEREVPLEDPQFKSTRDELFLVAVTYGEQVTKLYNDLKRPEDLEFGDREFNLFKPILAIGMATGDEEIVQRLKTFANTAHRQKIAQHNETAEENVVLRYLLDVVHEDTWCRSDDLHSGLVEFIRTNGLEVARAVTKSRLGTLLRKLQVISQDRRSPDRKTTVYFIERQTLEQVARNYQVI